jgi:hypothetical protein
VAKITIIFGALLILLGFIGYFGTGAATSLIPAYFGFAIAIFGAIALKPDYRKHAMHAAAAIATIALIGGLMMVIRALVKLSSGEEIRTRAVVMQTIMVVICGVFVALCVQSFIIARRNRSTQSSP